MNKSILAFAAGALVLTGCTTVDPLSGQTQASRATKGGIIGASGGAVAGALIGAATGNRRDARRGALIGAGVGLLAGAGIGAYMDQQERQLRQRLQGTGVNVVRRGNEIILIMPSNITFPSGASNISPNFFSTLDGVAIVLQEYPKTLVDVAGHTDSDGGEQFNLNLSQNRAQSVGQYLSGRGVDQRRLYFTGFGETRPIASNETGQGKAQNRRVEITIQPLS